MKIKYFLTVGQLLKADSFKTEEPDGLHCSRGDWQAHMPGFDPKRLSRKWSKLQKAKLKLFGGQAASETWNWVAQVSEIGDNAMWSEKKN
ncbi:Oidioi.mRNA.OKI2018_I69.chr2.g4676.t1.cds [Oikopleura dioica]|uniref:Oidioi.mRNA.OKI2018_I69.chr2.g4676.t1.cds n=1 Tax=Oikopleura dioica TaxID=34765 RepID=A0ABN7T2D8_OIKDI|nr:Oidioi.mRNA.OKI2018_I69.chr2.g4676.t1.cds [Oikopleura dioica]